MKRVIIADIKSNNNRGKCTGHFFALAKNYKAVLSADFNVMIAGGPIYNNEFPTSELLQLPYDGYVDTPFLKLLWHMVRNCIVLSQKTSKDDIIILQQSMPTMILLAIFLGFWGKANIFQIQYSENPMKRRSYRLLHALSRFKIKGTICPTSTVGNAYKYPYVVVPDYFYSKEIKVCDIPFSKKKYDFGIIGRINKNKGVIEACQFLKNTDFSAIIAGNPDSSIEGELRSTCAGASNIRLHLGYLSDAEYYSYLNDCRYCLLNYHGEYSEKSSGVVLDTLLRGIPVVGHKCRALQFVEDERLGLLFEKIDKFPFSSLFEESNYNFFCQNTILYRKTNIEQIEKLITFLKKE